MHSLEYPSPSPQPQPCCLARIVPGTGSALGPYGAVYALPPSGCHLAKMLALLALPHAFPVGQYTFIHSRVFIHDWITVFYTKMFSLLLLDFQLQEQNLIY